MVCGWKIRGRRTVDGDEEEEEDMRIRSRNNFWKEASDLQKNQCKWEPRAYLSLVDVGGRALMGLVEVTGAERLCRDRETCGSYRQKSGSCVVCIHSIGQAYKPLLCSLVHLFYPPLRELTSFFLHSYLSHVQSRALATFCFFLQHSSSLM